MQKPVFKGNPVDWKIGREYKFNLVRFMPTGRILIKFESPDEIWHGQNVVDFRKNYLNETYARVESWKLKPKLLVLVYDKPSDSVFRGQLLSGLGSDYEVSILAVDFGTVVKRRADSIFYITERYLEMPFESQLVHLSGLEFFEGQEILQKIETDLLNLFDGGTFPLTGIFAGIRNDGLAALRFRKWSKVNRKFVDVNETLLKELYTRCPIELPMPGDRSKLAKISYYEWNSETKARPIFYLQFRDSFNTGLQRKLDQICFDEIVDREVDVESSFESSGSTSSDFRSAKGDSVVGKPIDDGAAMENFQRKVNRSADKEVLEATNKVVELTTDEVYVARFEGSMYRAKFIKSAPAVTRQNKNSDSGLGDENIEVPMAEVWFMDYGNTAVIPVEDVKKAKLIDRHLTKIPPMCHKVHLIHIYKILDPVLFSKEVNKGEYFYVDVFPEVMSGLPLIRLVKTELDPSNNKKTSLNKLMCEAGVCKSSRFDLALTKTPKK